MPKITIPVPNFLGDDYYPAPPLTELQPKFVRAATIMGRWGMGPKTFKTLLANGILKPHIVARDVTLYALKDMLRVEREGWNQREGLPPSENYPLRGDLL